MFVKHGGVGRSHPTNPGKQGAAADSMARAVSSADPIRDGERPAQEKSLPQELRLHGNPLAPGGSVC